MWNNILKFLNFKNKKNSINTNEINDNIDQFSKKVNDSEDIQTTKLIKILLEDLTYIKQKKEELENNNKDEIYKIEETTKNLSIKEPEDCYIRTQKASIENECTNNPEDKSEKKQKGLLEKLNKEQYEATVDESNACLLNANVGSGKTTVLIAKIFYLSQYYDLTKMMVLTFTNKAANEIKERLKKSKIENIEKLHYCGTFHSVALSILKDKLPNKNIKYRKDFTIITPDEEVELAKELISEYGYNIKYKNILAKRLEDAKKKINKYDDDILKLYSTMQEEKIKLNKMNYDDILINANKLLKSESIELEWIVVDEFQDTNKLEFDFIKSLKKDNTKIFVVGDENQIIYSWRSSVKNIFKKYKELYNAKELSLPLNYRSTENILELARSVIGNNIKIIGTRNYNEKITILQHYDEFAEANHIVEKIREHIADENNKYSDIAILYRTQKQSNIISNVLEKENIPYEISKTKTLNEIPVLCWFISLLKCSINNNDKINFIKVLSDDNFGICSSKKAKILINENNETLVSKIRNFNDFISKEKDIREIYKYFELDTYIKPTSFQYAENRILLNALIEKISIYIKESDLNIEDALNEFINSSALYGLNILDKTINTENNSVKLMTLHAAKGLEFKYVFIIGANDGIIPLIKKPYNLEDIEEERRLFYVGITRAIDNLEISYYANPSTFGAFNAISRFLSTIHISDINDGTKENEPKSQYSNLYNIIREIDGEKESMRDENEGKNVLKVKHQRYGIGIVINETEDVLEVEFEKYGKKELLKELDFVERI